MTTKKKSPATLKKQRLQIINDVILRIKIGLFEPVNMCLIELPRKLKGIKEDRQLNEVMEKMVTPKKPCEGCMRGGLFVGAIMKFNHMTVRHATHADMSRHIDSEVLDEKLTDFWPDEHVKLIEAYFEKFDDRLIYAAHAKRMQVYSRNFFTAKKRMLAILLNMKDNDGMFKPFKKLPDLSKLKWLKDEN